MPEISALPAMPAAVGGPAPVAGVAPAAPVDPGALSFLATLKNALSGLASVALPQQAPLTATVATATPTVAAELSAQPDDAKDDPAPDVMPEMLAALGFLPVPTMLQPQVEPQLHAAPPAPQPATSPILAQLPNTPAPVAHESAPAPEPSAPADPQPLAQLPTDTTLTPQQVEAILPLALKPVTQDRKLEPLTPEHAPHESKAIAAPHAPTTTTAAATPINPALGSQHSEHDAQSSDGDSKESNPHLTTVAEPASPEPQIEAAAAGITTTAPIANAALPPHVRPSEVVNQIVHQADLYRLPGNKGVRIQLHPEDLGGVDVTLRYSAAGGIQLHINVEHASTGALVQSGWNELRDALATQGITPDRLVMSVSSPATSSGADFSSNGQQSSYRSDAGQMGFDQGRQGQREQSGGEPQRVSRAWFGDADAAPADDTRVAVSNGRIDYQA